MVHLRWKVLMHCADCADKFGMFIGAFEGVADVRVIIPEGCEDKTLFEGYIEFDLDISKTKEVQIQKEAVEEGFEVLK